MKGLNHYIVGSTFNVIKVLTTKERKKGTKYNNIHYWEVDTNLFFNMGKVVKNSKVFLKTKMVTCSWWIPLVSIFYENRYTFYFLYSSLWFTKINVYKNKAIMILKVGIRDAFSIIIGRIRILDSIKWHELLFPWD